MPDLKPQIKDIRKKKVEVVAGIIYCGDEILCVQRSQSKLSYISEKFEFPGGKIEVGESKEMALERELLEELKVQVSIEKYYLTVVHDYPDFELTMHSFICRIVRKSEVSLQEHISLRWLRKNELLSLDWAAADIPIANKIMTDEECPD